MLIMNSHMESCQLQSTPCVWHIPFDSGPDRKESAWPGKNLNIASRVSDTALASEVRQLASEVRRACPVQPAGTSWRAWTCVPRAAC